MAPTRHADHVIDLHFTAGPHAETAGNAGVQVDRHRHVAVVQQRNTPLFKLRETTFLNAIGRGHIEHVAGFVVGNLLLRHVCHQQFNHHLTRRLSACVVRGYNHPIRRFPNAGGRQGPFALNLHHTGAAIAVGAVAGGRFVT